VKDAVACASRAIIAATNRGMQETIDSQGLLTRRENHVIAAKYSRAEKFRAMICALIDRATPLASVVIAHLPLRRFGLSQRVL